LLDATTAGLSPIAKPTALLLRRSRHEIIESR